MRIPSIAMVLLATGTLALQGCNQYGRGPRILSESNPWFAAAASNDPAALNAAAESGANPNAHERHDFNTPLHIAAMVGNAEAIKLLLSKGAKPDAIDEDARTPLMIACYRSNTEAVKALLEAPEGIDAQDRQEQTALMFAARNGNLDIVKALIEKKAALDTARYDGATALHLAARDGHPNVIKALKEAGADVNIRDGRGRTPYDMAKLARRPASALALEGS